MAEIMFPSMARLALNISPLRKFMMNRMFPPGIHEYVLARTKVMDAAFLEALDNEFPQIVLLGAGFDTRALRFAKRNRDTKIFELDVATTQQAKIEVLRRKNIHFPAELIFVPIDFNKEDLSVVLSKAGFYGGEKCLFLWEGVTMYLSARSVDDTLSFIRTNAAPGSRVIFDYIYASVLRRENRFYGEQGIFNRVASTGEGWTFGLEAGEIKDFLGKRGFAVIAHYSPPDLEKLFLTEPDGSLHAHINGTHCIVLASVE